MESEEELRKLAGKKSEKQIEGVPTLAFEGLKKRFSYHLVDDTGRTKLEHIRNWCLDTAIAISNCVPEGREKALALTKLEEVMFWANAGIAREEQ